jgi:hypothetical protein
MILLPSRSREGLGVGMAWVKLASFAPTPGPQNRHATRHDDFADSPPLQGGEA